MVKNCPTCCKFQSQRAQPLIPSTLPSLPWQKVAMDIFEWEKASYLLVIDYYSRYIEIARLSNLTSREVITHTKSIFARHGVPEKVISDNGPQFSSHEFSQFSDQYCFEHVTSSPHYPQSNGETERAVQTVKRLLKKADDPYMALLAYRNTPLHIGYSPAQLLMSRRLRTLVPTIPSLRQPEVPDNITVSQQDWKEKERQKTNFDLHHGVQDLKPLLPGDSVWLTNNQTSGEILSENTTRSYDVEIPTGLFRRNRRHLISVPSNETIVDSEEQSISQTPTVTNNSDICKTRSGRIVNPPDRLDPSLTL